MSDENLQGGGCGRPQIFSRRGALVILGLIALVILCIYFVFPEWWARIPSPSYRASPFIPTP